MIKKALIALLSLVAVLAVTAYILYARNTAPVVREIPAAESSSANKPYVVKLHAQWCAACMLTKPAWSQIDGAYSTRVKLVVFDLTNEATTTASRNRAKRLGLENFFEENAHSTGTIAVLDGRTKKVIAEISGSRDFAEYRAAIDAALKAMTP
jgi:hypothetical protein